MKKSIFIGYLSGFLILTNVCFAQNSGAETTRANIAEISSAQKSNYSLNLALNIYDKKPQEALKIKDDTIAKTKEVLNKYNLKALRQTRYSLGMSAAEYGQQTTQGNIQLYAYITFTFENSDINFDDLVTELYSFGWTSISYDDYQY